MTFSGGIDGSDFLHIQGDQFWIEHRNWQKAGQHPDLTDHNLYVDGVPGDADTVWTIDPTLGTATPVVAISDGRGQVTVTQQPSASNGYETIVLINDDPEFGPSWYDVTIMPAASPSVPPPPTVLRAPYEDLTLSSGATLTVGTAHDPDNLVQLASAANGNPSGLGIVQVTDGNPAAAGRQLTVNADGSFSYTPPTGFVGTDWFTYQCSDTNGDASMYGTVYFAVLPAPKYSVNAPDYITINDTTANTASLAGGTPGSAAVWKSSDESILQITGQQVANTVTLKPLKPGTVTVTAQAPDGTQLSKQITVVKIQIDPVVPFQNGQGQLVTPDISQLNSIWNPAAIVIPPAGTDPATPQGAQLLAGTAGVVTLTDVEPANLNLTTNDARIQWKITADGPNGGSANFFGEHLKGQPNDPNTGYGSEVHLYGVTHGRILLTAYLDPGGGRPLVQLDQYEALVTNELDVPYREQILGNQMAAEDATKQLRAANSFLWQAGVKLVPDANGGVTRGSQARAAGVGVFVDPGYDPSKLDVDMGPSRDAANQLIGENAVANVLNIVYVNTLKNSVAKNDLAGNAVSVPKPKLNGAQGFNVSLKYRIDLQDSIGGGPHVMHMFDGHHSGAFPSNVGILLSNAAFASLGNIGLGGTLAHETGHYLHLAHREVPPNMPAGGIGPFQSSSSDGLSQPVNLNLMSAEPLLNAQENRITTQDDLDLIQTYVMHGLLP